MTDRPPAAQHRFLDRDSSPWNRPTKAVHFDGLIYATGMHRSTRVVGVDPGARIGSGIDTIDGRRRDASDGLKWLRAFGCNAKRGESTMPSTRTGNADRSTHSRPTDGLIWVARLGLGPDET